MSKSSTVRLTYRWSNGDSLHVSVEAASSYPDALDEARSAAHKEMTELLDKLVRMEAETTE